MYVGSEEEEGLLRVNGVFRRDDRKHVVDVKLMEYCHQRRSPIMVIYMS
jgi:hypothetical protein